MRYLSVMFVAVLLGIVAIAAAEAPADAAAKKAPVFRNLATREAQRKLVDGLAPVKPKIRFLRDLNAPKPAEPLRLPPPPYDLSNTPEGKAAFAELEKIKRNIAGSDWPKEPARGKERVIFASDEGKEHEFEYDTAELAALARKAMARGINNAIEEEGEKRSDAVEPPLVIPVAWAGGTDNRVVKSISTTYPINHRVLRRIGEFNGGGCSGALIGLRLVLTAAHCIVQADLSYKTHAFRARRSGAQMPYGTESSVGYW